MIALMCPTAAAFSSMHLCERKKIKNKKKKKIREGGKEGEGGGRKEGRKGRSIDRTGAQEDDR